MALGRGIVVDDLPKPGHEFILFDSIHGVAVADEKDGHYSVAPKRGCYLLQVVELHCYGKLRTIPTATAGDCAGPGPDPLLRGPWLPRVPMA